jgi:predicted nucleic acid-binding protein
VFAILDTNVYIDHWERGAHTEALGLVERSLIVRHSAVVLSELRRGAHTRQARRVIESLRRLAPIIWTPTEADWWQAGEMVARVGVRCGWDASKKRAFQNDVLIGLTARRHGALLITSNRADFERIAEEVPLRLWFLHAA